MGGSLNVKVGPIFSYFWSHHYMGPTVLASTSTIFLASLKYKINKLNHYLGSLTICIPFLTDFGLR